MRSLSALMTILIITLASGLTAENRVFNPYRHTETFTYDTSISSAIDQTVYKAQIKCAQENGTLNIFGAIQTSETLTNTISEEFYNKYVALLMRDTIVSTKQNTDPEIVLNPLMKTFSVTVDLKLELAKTQAAKHDFDFEARLNKSLYAVDDPAWIEYQFTEPLYLLIANVLGDSVSVWFYTQTKVDKNTRYRYPDQNELPFQMTLDPGQGAESGAFCFVVARKMLPLALHCDTATVGSKIIPKKLSVEQFYSCINRDDIELKLLPYVTKRSM